MSSGNGVKTLFKPAEPAPISERHDLIDNMGEVETFSTQELDEQKIIYPGMANPNVLNVFRGLRTRLLKASKGANFSCLVTSVCSGGGTTHIAKNLAASFSLDKSKTSLLVDANLYNPSLNSLIIGASESGLTDYLSEQGPQVNIKDIVYATGVPRMRVIPIGGYSEAAAEYFSSQTMQLFSEEVRKRYSDRYILVDAPPILEASETQILIDIADLVLLVVPYGKVTNEEISEAVEKIDPSKFVGIVYNN
jgi:protein-tyrosine kinase